MLPFKQSINLGQKLSAFGDLDRAAFHQIGLRVSCLSAAQEKSVVIPKCPRIMSVEVEGDAV